MIIDTFLGLQNTADELKLKPGSLVRADNVLITKAGCVKRRNGKTLRASATNITGTYATSDGVYLFAIDNGSLCRFDGNALIPLATGFPNAPSFWCEESPSLVFCKSGDKYVAIVEGQSVVTLKMLTGLLDLDDRALDVTGVATAVMAMTYHRASVVTAHKADSGSVVAYSLPGEYGTFPINEDRFEVPDEVRVMESVNGRLLICCAHSIYSHAENRLVKLADYGVPFGKSITKLPDNGCLIWTHRGVCSYPEFNNLTQDTVSLPPGVGCATALYEAGGDRYFLIGNDGGGAAYNAV